MLYEGFNQEYKIHVFDQYGKNILTFDGEYEPVTKEFRMDELVRKKTQKKKRKTKPQKSPYYRMR